MSGEAKGNDTDEGGKQKMKGIEEPGETDVLCGRGGAALRHPGNQTYRRLVHLNKGLYITCLKAEKLKISRSIVAAIREQNGRFLEKEGKASTWYDIGDKKAMEKTSQALREGQPKLRQKIVELGGGATGAAALLESQFPTGVYTGDAANQQQQMQQQIHMQHHQQQQQQIQVQHHQMQQPGIFDNNMPPPQPRDFQNNDFPNNEYLNNNAEMYSNNMPLTGTTIQEEPMLLNRNLRKTSLISSIDGQSIAQSQISLMSDYSNFGVGSIGTISIPAAPSYAATPNSLASGGTSSSDNKQRNMDRRKYFASMKYSRPPSGRFGNGGGRTRSSRQLYASNRSLGDGMPDIHLVESNPSLYSNISGPSQATSTGHTQSVEGPNSKAQEISRIFESRRSLMSGDGIGSRYDDARSTDMNSIFSDLSGKIGNVSTRSIAMSEMSDFDRKIVTNASTRSMAMSEISNIDDQLEEAPPLYEFDPSITAASDHLDP